MSVPTGFVSAPYAKDRTYFSRLAVGPLLLGIIGPNGEATVADALPEATLHAEYEPNDGPWTLTVTTETVDGRTFYRAYMPVAATATEGPLTVQWAYTLQGIERLAEQHLVIGPTSPAYDSLSEDLKVIVDQVWLRMADQFDSPYGGPHLQVYAQTHFGRNRIAQLIPQALGRLNLISQPHQTFNESNFPYEKWGALLERALWVEVIKHLRRSYFEQPDVSGVTIARLDRQRYAEVWGSILADEVGDLEAMLEHFKMAHMGLGGGSLIVAGGIFPRVSASVALRSLAAPRGLFLHRGW